MKHVYLIRHAQTVMNNERRFSGVLDCEIDDTGYKQLEKLREKMKEYKVQQCYCSPLKRTVLTALSFFDNPIKVNDLHEMNFGDIEGMKFTDGESQRTFNKRVNKVFYDILKADDNSSIAIVSHSCVIRQIISNAMVKDSTMSWNIHIGNCSITKLEVHPNRTILAFLNK